MVIIDDNRNIQHIWKNYLKKHVVQAKYTSLES